MHIARTLAQRHYFHAYAFVSARMDAHAGVRRPDHLAECHGIVSTRSFLRNILRLTVTRTLAIYHFFFFHFLCCSTTMADFGQEIICHRVPDF